MPLIVVWLKPPSKQKFSSGSCIWAFLSGRCVSFLSAYRFAPISLAAEVAKTVVLVWAETISTVLSLILALNASGAGRGPSGKDSVSPTLVKNLNVFFGCLGMREPFSWNPLNSCGPVEGD